MATVKKSITKKPMTKKAKSGAKFPDLNKDGKITKADILKGRGVIAKKGVKTAKAQKGLTIKSKAIQSGVPKAAPVKSMEDRLGDMTERNFQKTYEKMPESQQNRFQSSGVKGLSRASYLEKMQEASNKAKASYKKGGKITKTAPKKKCMSCGGKMKKK